MSIEQAFHDRWENDVPISALIPVARVFTGNAAGDPALAYVTARRTGGRTEGRTSTGTSLRRAVLEATVWTDDLDEGKLIVTEMIRLYDGADFSLAVGAVLDMRLTDHQENMNDDGIWQLTLTFSALTTTTN
jgi:hypothetical protein